MPRTEFVELVKEIKKKGKGKKMTKREFKITISLFKNYTYNLKSDEIPLNFLIGVTAKQQRPYRFHARPITLVNYLEPSSRDNGLKLPT